MKLPKYFRYDVGNPTWKMVTANVISRTLCPFAIILFLPAIPVVILWGLVYRLDKYAHTGE